MVTENGVPLVGEPHRSLALRDVTYAYARRAKPVLDGLSLEFRPGFTALLGKNGAGKSTVLNLLATVVTPGSGSVAIDGVPVRRQDIRAYRSRIGWMPQNIPVLPRFTVRESVEYYGWLAVVPRQELAGCVRSALRSVDLQAKARERVSTLSGGQLRRLGVAQALVHDAEWLILDEPTAGLDPVQRHSLFELLRSLRGTVNCIVSTHDIDGFETVTGRVSVLDSGRNIWNGSVGEFSAFARRRDTATGSAGDAWGSSAGDAAFVNLLETVTERSSADAAESDAPDAVPTRMPARTVAGFASQSPNANKTAEE